MNKNSTKSEPVLRKHVGLIHCENRLSLLQRKICNVLLFNVLDKINEQDTYEIGLKHLCSLIGYNSNDIALIKRALKGLISTVLEWNLLDKDKLNSATKETNDSELSPIIWHASSLLAGVTIKDGVISYSYSPQIKTILSSLDIYGRINLFIQAKFKSSYSLVLYENCVRFKNIQQTCWFNLNLFRNLMGVEEGKYATFKELKRNVITPAVNEINNKADISIQPEFRKMGKKVIAIKFFITENKNYFPKIKRKDKSFTPSTAILEQELMNKFHFSNNEITNLLKNYDKAYIEAKIKLVLSSDSYKQNKINNLQSYLLSFIDHDYKANTTQINQSNAIRQPDENTILQIKESLKTGALQKKYTKYKLKMVFDSFYSLELASQNLLIDQYKDYLSKNAQKLLQIYIERGFSSTVIAYDFLVFLEKTFPDYLPKFLTYDEFLTAEECELEISL